MQINIVTAIGIAGTLSGIVLGYLGYRIGLKKDYYEKGGEATGIKKDIEYIKEKIDRVDCSQGNITVSLTAIMERLIKVEEAAKSAHKRLDEHIRLGVNERRAHPRKGVSEGM